MGKGKHEASFLRISGSQASAQGRAGPPLGCDLFVALGLSTSFLVEQSSSCLARVFLHYSWCPLRQLTLYSEVAVVQLHVL